MGWSRSACRSCFGSNRSRQHEHTIDHGLRLVVAGERATPLGAVPRFSVQTWNLRGEPIDADVTWRLLGDQPNQGPATGRVVLAQSDATIKAPPIDTIEEGSPSAGLTIPPIGSD